MLFKFHFYKVSHESLYMAPDKLKSTAVSRADSPLSFCQGQKPEPSLRKEGFVQTLVPGWSPSWWRSHPGRSSDQVITLCPWSDAGACFFLLPPFHSVPEAILWNGDTIGNVVLPLTLYRSTLNRHTQRLSLCDSRSCQGESQR